jgi:hypothetical protein
MATNYSPRLPLSNCVTLVDWANPRCYSGNGTQFVNLIDSTKNNGYLKGNSFVSTDPGGNLSLTTPGQGQGTNLVGDRIDIETSQADRDRFNKNNNFTFIFWVNRTGDGNKLLSTGSSGSSNTDSCIWQMWINADRFYWWNTSGGSSNNITCNFSTTPSTQEWYMVSVTYTSGGQGGTNIVRGFRDGELINTGSRSYDSHSARDRRGQNNLQWTLGGGYNSSCRTDNSAASFGIFALYNESLSPVEIKTFYTSTKKRFGK